MTNATEAPITYHGGASAVIGEAVSILRHGLLFGAVLGGLLWLHQASARSAADPANQLAAQYSPVVVPEGQQ